MLHASALVLGSGVREEVATKCRLGAGPPRDIPERNFCAAARKRSSSPSILQYSLGPERPAISRAMQSRRRINIIICIVEVRLVLGLWVRLGFGLGLC